YVISALQPGTYEVTGETAGFTMGVRKDLLLEVAQTARVDFILQVGNTSETVNVTASAAVLETETASTGQVVDNRKVVELPLNGRQFYGLALLGPDTYQPAENSTVGYRGGFNVAGADETENNFSLNGIDNNDSGINGPTFLPSIDSIQEFKILTGIFPAEYGHSAGSQVIVVTKSGTNEIHGSLFEFVRNQFFDARNYFLGAGHQPAYKRNQFGGTAGAPIKKDKTFFFYSYEGLRLRQGITSLATVPTTAMLNGNFSSLLTLAKPIQLKNPVTGAIFSGDIIPASTISTLGRGIAAFFPAPTTATPSGVLPSANYVFNETRVETMNEQSLRIDHSFSSTDSFYANYNRYNDPSFEPQNALCGSSTLPGFGCHAGLTTQLGAIDETHIISPAMVNEFRAGVNRLVQPRVQQDNTADFPGLPGAFLGYLANNNGVPRTSITGYSTLGGATNLPSERDDTTYQITDAITWTRGKHSIKFGGEWRKFLSSNLQTSNGRGSLTFSGSAPGPTSGYPLADLLLGLPTTSSRNPYSPWFYERLGSMAAFVQDDFKVTPTLTLNIGLRYEYEGVISEKYGRMSSFDPTVPGGGLRVENENGLGNTLYQPNYKNFAPRFGFAWQPHRNSSTVIRSGYGIFYNQTTTLNGFYTLATNAPFRNPQTFTSTVANPIQLDVNPFPASLSANSSTASGVNPHFPTAYVQQWNFDVEHQFGQTLLLDIGYRGAKGTDLPLSFDPNQPLPGTGNAGRPYQNFGNITYYIDSGNSEFHSLVFKLDKKISHGLSFLASYTFGKSIDEGSGAASGSDASGVPQNSRNLLSGERGLSDFNVAHRLVFTPVWALPFGESGKGVAAQIIRGWQISGIFQLQSGRPFTANESGNISLTSQNADRPNVIFGCNPNNGPKTVNEWMNISCFTLPPTGTFGDVGRNTLIGPGMVTLDTAVARMFAIRERMRLQFRGEAFNTVNHPNFEQASGTQNSPSFGRITATLIDNREIQLALKMIF
ncbi:MAG: TonB-dependent receptor, partial [Acidobacteriia bacterium]|nr:TonB-dependent receptor [Terriglobia bacterium]